MAPENALDMCTPGGCLASSLICEMTTEAGDCYMLTVHKSSDDGPRMAFCESAVRLRIACQADLFFLPSVKRPIYCTWSAQALCQWLSANACMCIKALARFCVFSSLGVAFHYPVTD